LSTGFGAVQNAALEIFRQEITESEKLLRERERLDLGIDGSWREGEALEFKSFGAGNQEYISLLASSFSFFLACLTLHQLFIYFLID
jgi:hypothetical protein